MKIWHGDTAASSPSCAMLSKGKYVQRIPPSLVVVVPQVVLVFAVHSPVTYVAFARSCLGLYFPVFPWTLAYKQLRSRVRAGVRMMLYFHVRLVGGPGKAE